VAVVPSNPPTEAPARTLLAAVFLLGALFSLLGSVLPVWGYHRLEAFLDAGFHFLAMAGGFLAGNAFCAIYAGRHPRVFLGPVPGSLLSILGVGLFALLPPPFPLYWQLAGAVCVGMALGSLSVMVFHQTGFVYRFNTSAAFQLTGLVALLGVCATPLGVAMVAIPTGSVALLALAVVPAVIATTALLRRAPAIPAPPALTLREALDDFRNPTAILLALLLFFQMGTELALFGWLPVFLIQCLGVSPSLAVYALAAFGAALLVGRTASQALRERARRNRVLLSGLAVAILGCLMLLSTNNLFGAFLGIALAGLGFSPIFPVALERMAHRFPYYHPGILNALFAIGFLGGMLAPFSLGYFAGEFGIRIIMALPIAGSLVVAALLILLWLESRLVGSAQ
jgi:MFS family permease